METQLNSNPVKKEIDLDFKESKSLFLINKTTSYLEIKKNYTYFFITML